MLFGMSLWIVPADPFSRIKIDRRICYKADRRFSYFRKITRKFFIRKLRVYSVHSSKFEAPVTAGFKDAAGCRPIFIYIAARILSRHAIKVGAIASASIAPDNPFNHDIDSGDIPIFGQSYFIVATNRNDLRKRTTSAAALAIRGLLS